MTIETAAPHQTYLSYMALTEPCVRRVMPGARLFRILSIKHLTAEHIANIVL
jgi:hypothetical protein